eukprot:5500590-Pyramimonas_sp.AAC.1
MDRLLEFPRCSPEGRLTPHSAPWARQVKDDLQALADVDTRFDQIWTDKENVLQVLKDPQLGKRFAKVHVGLNRDLLNISGKKNWTYYGDGWEYTRASQSTS